MLAEIFAKNFTGLIGDPLIDLRVVGLAVGVLLGGLGHFLFQAYFVFKELYRGTGPLRFSLFSNKDLWRVFKLMAPAALASSAGSVNLLINTISRPHWARESFLVKLCLSTLSVAGRNFWCSPRSRCTARHHKGTHTVKGQHGWSALATPSGRRRTRALALNPIIYRLVCWSS